MWTGIVVLIWENFIEENEVKGEGRMWRIEFNFGEVWVFVRGSRFRRDDFERRVWRFVVIVEAISEGRMWGDILIWNFV